MKRVLTLVFIVLIMSGAAFAAYPEKNIQGIDELLLIFADITEISIRKPLVSPCQPLTTYDCL